MKQDAVNGDHHNQGDEESHQCPNVALLLFGHQIDDFADNQLHCSGPVNKMVSPLHKAITRFLQLPVLRMALGDGFLSDIYARFGPHTRMAGRQKK
jgi:hypothetical protein